MKFVINILTLVFFASLTAVATNVNPNTSTNDEELATDTIEAINLDIPITIDSLESFDNTINKFEYDSSTVDNLFRYAPDHIFPILPRPIRLDMVDYFTSGFDTPSKNLMGGSSRITALSPRSVSISATPASEYQLFTLNAGDSKQYIGLIKTIYTPQHDSWLTIFDSNWRPVEKIFDAPRLTDWLTPQGRKHKKEIEEVVTFLLTEYLYNPADETLTITNNSSSAFSPEAYGPISQYLRESLTYKWNGKRFTLQK